MSSHCISPNCVALPLPHKQNLPETQSLLTKITQWWVLRRQQRINRNAFNHLLSLDDKFLKDIGVTRGDVVWASNLPKSVDASIELEIVARRRGKDTL